MGLSEIGKVIGRAAKAEVVKCHYILGWRPGKKGCFLKCGQRKIEKIENAIPKECYLPCAAIFNH